MTGPLNRLYPPMPKSIWVLYDLRSLEACNHLHEQRGFWQEESELAALGPDHMILIPSPGGAAKNSGATKEAQRD